MKNLAVAIASLLALTAATDVVSVARAGTGATTLHVSATILPALRFSATMDRGTYEVTATDLERGFVELPDAVTVDLQANFNGPVDLRIAGGGEERIVFAGSRSSIERLEVQQSLTPTRRNLDLQVILPGDAREGTYSLQAQLQPLTY